MNIAICENEIRIANQVENVVIEYSQECDISCMCSIFLSGERLLKQINSDKITSYYHIYLLDIELHQIDGMEVAKIIREQDPEAIIIFITSHTELVYKAFDVSAFHFLTKPVNSEVLKSILKKAIKHLTVRNTFFNFSTNRKVYSLSCKQIEYFESYGRKITIYTKNSEDTFNGRLKDIKLKLPTYFIYINKSCIVNLENIEMTNSDTIRMCSGKILNISRKYKSAFYNEYKSFIHQRI